MNIQELQQFIEETKIKINKKYGVIPSSSEELLSSMVKLSEEVWELAEQVMKQRKRQHLDKWDFILEDMEDEIADVIFATSMIACDIGINLENALERKKKKILQKFS